MQQNRRRERRPHRRTPVVRAAPVARVQLAGARVVVVGFFSAKQKDFGALMDAAVADLTARGARVAARVVQRRGVSGGGAKKMHLPYSSRTLLSSGKVREAAATCEETGADAVVFLADLTDHQHRVLEEVFGRPVMSLTDVFGRAARTPTVQRSGACG
jgi:50S ribosomal subunit-associated GTPase HflX